MEDIIDIIVTETTNLIEITSQPTDEVIDVNIIDNREDITLNVTPSVIEININSLTGNFGVNWGDINGTLSNQTDLQDALDLKADLVDGKVPSSQLPSYVDDVIEVATYSALPATGEVGKIYVVLDTNKIYRWSGSAYIEIADSTAVWGAITGTLSSQTDLQSALDAKQNQLNGTGFVKASGTSISYDNSTYLTTSSAASTYVPYTGATGNVDLGTHTLSSHDLVVNHASGSGVAVSITKGGNGEALTVVKSSGSGNAASITGGVTLLDELHLNTDLADAYIASASVWNAKQNALSGTGFVKISGTTISYDNSTYALDSAVVHNTGNETIAGQKTFTSGMFGTTANFSSSISAQTASISNTTASVGLYITHTNTSYHAVSITATGGSALYVTGSSSFNGAGYFTGQVQADSLGNRTGQGFTFPTVSGTLALTSDLSSYLPLSGGTLTGALSGTSASFTGNMTIGEDLTLTNVGTAASNILATSTSGTLSLTAGASSGYTGGGTIELVANDRSGTNTRGEVYISAGNASANTANGFIALQTANTERLRVTYSGNVGIGTTSPSEKLHVVGVGLLTTATATAYSSSNTLNSGTSLRLLNDGVLNLSAATIRLDASGGDGSLAAASISSVWTGSASSDLTFGTRIGGSSVTERMRITSGGKLIVGATSDGNTGLVQIHGTARAVQLVASQGGITAGNYAIYGHDDDNGYINIVRSVYTGDFHFRFDGTTRATINRSTGVYVATSDINKKKDLEESKIGLSEVMQLKPTLYRMKIDSDNSEKQLGFIAQEVKRIIPSAYQESGDFIGLNYNPIVAALTKAVQEQQNQIQELKSLLNKQ